MRPFCCLAAAALFLGCGGPLFEADLAVQEWCQTMDRREIPAAPSAPTEPAVPGARSVADAPVRLQADVPEELPEYDPDAPVELALEGAWTLPRLPTMSGEVQQDLEVELLRVELHAEGLEDMAFLHDAELIAKPEGTPLVIAKLREAMVARAMALLMPPAPRELTSLFSGDKLPVTTRLAGTLPKEAWVLEVRGCFRGRGHVAWDGPAADATAPDVTVE